MTFKKFVKYGILLTLGIIISVVGFNIYKNEFGLFGDVEGKKIRIYNEERTTKYLLSFNWIPQNFDAFLFGPSLSDVEMDTSKIKNLKIYNLSLNGANISELKYPVENLIKSKKMKLMIVCLDPYLTKNSGKKTSGIDPREYWSTLGSLFTIKYYLKKYLALQYPKQDVYRDSWSGFRYNNYDVYKKYDSKERIESAYNSIQNGTYEIPVDQMAIKELKDVLKLARNYNIQILAYYYPRHKRIVETKLYQEEYGRYKDQIKRILKPQDIVIDFNTKKYDYIRSKYSTYSDGSHLSTEGGEKMIDALNEVIIKYKLGEL